MSRLLREPMPDQDYRDELSERATFEGSSKHKADPFKFGMDAFTGARLDWTYCDEDAGFEPGHLAVVPTWLHTGIQAGLIGREERAHREPALIWAIGYDGWIFEGRITHVGQAVYHGYPVLQNDPTAGVILARHRAWVHAHATPELERALVACEGRYT